ncbi:MAG: DNA polymerase III subunit epsilon [Endozoicomonadaceae bacterium]|nr:DNA polymerase III subunit epsilon [Endozoicomonadaceae bacterium]
MSRIIVLDTETTGITPTTHRIIEIGCIEIINRQITNNNYHVYINPQRQVDEQAFAVHGLSNEFLADKPVFQEIATDFLQFIHGAELVIHNAPFDVGFINQEFSLLATPLAPVETYCKITDTLVLAREKHVGQKNSLDALCKRYQIDHSGRTLHGALLDAGLLAEVYLKMTGGQTHLMLTEENSLDEQDNFQFNSRTDHQLPLRVIKANEQELKAHNEKLTMITRVAGKPCIWEQLQPVTEEQNN